MTNTEPTGPQKVEKKKQGKILSYFLDVINSILGSLSGAIPGVDMIKEYKEMAEHGYNQSQDEAMSE